MILTKKAIELLTEGKVSEEISNYYELLKIDIDKEIEPIISNKKVSLGIASIHLRADSEGLVRFEGEEYPIGLSHEMFLLNPGNELKIKSVDEINLPSFIAGKLYLKQSISGISYSQDCYLEPGYSGQPEISIYNFSKGKEYIPVYAGQIFGILSLELVIPI